MTNIALVMAPAFDPMRATRDSAPLGIGYLAASLRAAGYSVRLLDANAPGDGTTSQLDGIVRWVTREPTQMLGLSVTIRGFEQALGIARAVKARMPGLCVVMGGQHATTVCDEILAAYPEIDVVVRGEGEVTLVELCRALEAGTDLGRVAGIGYRDDIGVHRTADRPLVQDLDQLACPAGDLMADDCYLPFFDLQSGRALRVATVVSSRGCPYSCTFCSIHNFYRTDSRGWRERSAENVAREVDSLVADHGVGYIGFVDDNFFIKPHRAVAIVEELERLGRRVLFSFATRVDQIIRGRDVLPTLKSFGLRRVELGLEHGSQPVLDRLGKRVSVAANREALRILRSLHIMVKVDWIMFDPDITLDELSDGLSFILSERLDAHFPPLVTTSLELLPGTEAYDRMRAQGRCGEAVRAAPIYEFSHPDTAAVFEGVRRFLNDYQPRLAALLDRIEQLALDLRSGELAPASRDLPAELLGLAIGIKRVPYRVFGALLEGVREGRRADDVYARATAGTQAAVGRAAALLDAHERTSRVSSAAHCVGGRRASA